MTMRHLLFAALLVLSFLTVLGAAPASEPAEGAADLSKTKGDTNKVNEANWVRRTDPAMEHWRQDRFGIMIHWGIYAIPGGVWKGKTIPYAAEWIKSAAHIPNDEYEQLATQCGLNGCKGSPILPAQPLHCTDECR